MEGDVKLDMLELLMWKMSRCLVSNYGDDQLKSGDFESLTVSSSFSFDTNCEQGGCKTSIYNKDRKEYRVDYIPADAWKTCPEYNLKLTVERGRGMRDIYFFNVRTSHKEYDMEISAAAEIGTFDKVLASLQNRSSYGGYAQVVIRHIDKLSDRLD